jgi:hypothetical protein
MHTLLKQTERTENSLEIETLAEKLDQKFYVTERCLITVFLEKNNLYMAISYDNGHSFTSPKIIIKDIEGNIEQIEMLANNRNFVVALKEVLSNRQYKRAVTGFLKPNGEFIAKPCEKLEVKGEIINIQLAFREDISGDLISWDYTWWKSEDKLYLNCQPHK